MAEDVFDSVALFEYHDEALAPSSKLDQKVPEDIIRERFLRAKAVWDKLYAAKEKNRH
jgi:tRNA A37 methylthiotransferase MiaB